MGVIIKTVQEDIEKIVDITCDKCDRTCIGEYGNFCGISFSLSGGPDSPIFPDDEKEIELCICEQCAHEWLSTWSGDYLNYVTGEVIE